MVRIAVTRTTSSILQRPEEIGAAEPIEARPHADERRPRRLRLETDSRARHRIERGRALAGKEHLPSQRGAVQLTCTSSWRFPYQILSFNHSEESA